MRKEVADFAIAQKTERGLYILDAHLKHRMKAEGVVPNIWVFPPKMQIFLTMQPSSEVVYAEHGPGNQENLDKGPANMLTFRGSEVHEASPIDVDFVGRSHDLMSRERMIGSYYTMFDKVPLSGTGSASYRSDQRAIYIYDANADDFLKIHLQKALSSCMRFDDDGKLKAPTSGDSENKRGDIFTLACPDGTVKNATTIGQLLETGHISSDMHRAMAEGFRDLLQERGDNEGDFIAAFEKVVRGNSGAFAASDQKAACGAGIESGASREGSSESVEVRPPRATKKRKNLPRRGRTEPTVGSQGTLTEVLSSDYQHSTGGKGNGLDTAADVLNRMKLTRANFETLIKLNIRLPFGFLLLRPFQRYDCSSAILAQGGRDLGVTFHGHHDFQLTDDVIHKTHIGHYTFYSKTVIKNEKNYVIAEDCFATKYKGGENSAFFTTPSQFQDAASGSEHHHSLISVIIPHDRYADDGTDMLKNPLDMCGKFQPIYSADLLDGDEVQHYPGAELLCQTLDLPRLDWGDENDTSFNPQYRALNRVCFQGRQFGYDWSTNKFTLETMETGHWGKCGTYAGCRAAREGRGMLNLPAKESILV
jgi:hypothetical protein